MRFKNISLSEYRSLAQELKTGPLVALINQLNTKPYKSETESAKILLGASIYHLQKIKKNFKFWSPMRDKTYKSIVDKLKISEKNPLLSDECYIYVSKFKKYCQSQLNNNDDANKKLLNDIEVVRKDMLESEEKVVNYLVNQTPELKILRERIRTVPETYRKCRQSETSCVRNFLHSSNRDLMCEFIENVLERCDQLFMRDKDINELYEQEEKIYKGLAIFILMDILKKSWFPKGNRFFHGSDLYHLTLKCINKNELDEFSYQQRITCLDTLLDFLKEMEKPEYLPIERSILQYRTRLKEADIEHSFTHKGVSMTANVVTQAAIYCAAESLIPKAVDMSLGYAAGFVGGPIGEVAYLGSKYVMGRALGLTMTAISMWIAGKVGHTVGEKTASFIADRHNETDPKGIAKSINKLSASERIILYKYVNALLDSPSLSEDKKKNLRNGFGLKEGEKCKIKLPNDAPKVTFWTKSKAITPNEQPATSPRALAAPS